MLARPTICLMLKAPQPGKVKTRLALSVGEEEAVRIYRELAQTQLNQIPLDWPLRVYFAPDEAESEMIRWLGEFRELKYRAQEGGDLGERLARAAERELAQNPLGVIFLGGDCPYVTLSHLEQIEAALRKVSVVVGPAADGGYWTIGLRSFDPELFDGILWSTPQVLTQTLEKVRGLNWDYQLLELLEDVDDLASWERARLACASQLTA